MKNYWAIRKFECHINEYTKSLRKILTEVSKSPNDLKSNVVLFNNLERILYGWEGIKKNLPGLRKDFMYYYSIALVSRGVLVDSITSVYLISKIKKDIQNNIVYEEDFIKVCESLDFEYVKAKVDMINESDQTEEQKRIKIEEMRDFYNNQGHDYFEVKEGKLGVKEIKNAGFEKLIQTKMFKNLNKEEGVEGQFRIALFLFRYLSQFQHASNYTKQLLYDHKDLNFDNLIKTLSYSLYASYYILGVINVDTKHSEKMTSIAEKIEKFEKNYLEGKYNKRNFLCGILSI
jgi:hypothetical protein